ncbi:MAG: cbb3-type cytochrome c oxidase subunit I [Bacteroidetes bacterium]|nr:cbb3-type cytochrome c oxidase subunit I [Bacteroidota bacterium]
MFTNVRWFVKTSIVFMLAGILSGFFMMLARRVFEIGYGPSLLSAHTHVILVGFMMMMIMGVSIWFFPKAEKTDKRYSPALVVAVYWLMVIGTSVRFIGEFADAFVTLKFLNYIIVFSSLLQIIAAGIFVYTIWGRVRPVGSQIREAKGERF